MQETGPLQETGAANAAEPAETRPLLLVRRDGNLRLIHAADARALARGLAPGQRLADALACVPEALVEAADPAGDLAALHQLAHWATRFSPHAAADAPDGILADITGCAHLWGGEANLLRDALARLRRQGFAARGAIAGTIGAAWACARFGGEESILPPGSVAAALEALPVRALRLDDATAAALDRLGLRRIGALYPLPRADIVQRFGPALLTRLDQALGQAAETLSPLLPQPDHRVSLVFAEPIATPEQVALAAGNLLKRLLADLVTRDLGLRRLGLVLHRLDDTAPGCIIGTAQPSQDEKHLLKLLLEKAEALDPGPGIERMSLAALATQPMARRQAEMMGRALGEMADIAPLIDRLGNRFGAQAIARPEAIAGHLPERAVAFVPPLQKRAADWQADLPPRPIRLLSPPEPIDAMAPVPDDPPLSFRWRHVLHRVARAEGPERLRPEWWQAADDAAETRDYYRVEIEDGRRFWLYRSGLYQAGRGQAGRVQPGRQTPPRWFLHGIFA
ncbi:protein ImuB [Dongia mobilis]|uniref:Protein ImuB n=1 Tax=Dongia mobilis TaxID=578943 RepID=A0A4R6WZX3_9PROT|nr:protein ImuB [Dongia mobilis]